MSKKSERINHIAKKWEKGKISKEEISEFETWYNSFDDSQRTVNNHRSEKTLGNAIYKKIQAKIKTEFTPTRKESHSFLKTKWSIAASVTGILLVASVFLYFNSSKQETSNLLYTQSSKEKQDVMPGGNHAILRTADGQFYQLGRETIKVTDGENSNISASDIKLTVSAAPMSENSLPSYHVLTVPSKSQFKVELPDGSYVWLNAESQLTFPNRFSKNKRTVFLSGEAYFEIAKQNHAPFEVITDAQTVEVLGTQFNIKAYRDEPHAITSLLEGKVRLVRGDKKAILRPGQQGITSSDATNTEQILLQQTDVKKSISWKDGLFDFNNADIYTIMRTIARWYNVSVEYRGISPDRKFSGKFYRHITLQETLSLLNYSGIVAELVENELPDKEGKVVVFINKSS